MDIYQAVVYILVAVGGLLLAYTSVFKANSQQNVKLTEANAAQTTQLIGALTAAIKDTNAANQSANEHDFKVIQSLVKFLDAHSENTREQTAQMRKGFGETETALNDHRRILEQNLALVAQFPQALTLQTETITSHQQDQTQKVLAAFQPLRDVLEDIRGRVRRASEQIDVIETRLLAETAKDSPPLAVPLEGGENNDGAAPEAAEESQEGNPT